MSNPDFDNALDALTDFASKIDVDLEEVEPEFFGDFASAGFDLRDRVVRYSSNLESDPEKMIYVLAHELGHAMDLDDMDDEERLKFLESTRFYNECVVLQSEFPYCVRNFVLASEKIACEYGELILKMLGITYGSRRIKSIRNRMLLAYRLFLR